VSLEAGIIAAGLGTRLAESHPGLPKPLVPLAGKPLCHWIAGSLKQAGVERITVLHNSSGRAIRDSLTRGLPDVRWTFLEADTASSWESFRLVSRTLAESADCFLMSTVDAIVPPAETRRFAQACAAAKAEAGLALTSFVDDEKPLWSQLDASGRVAALGDRCSKRELVTSGLYYMTASAARRMPEAGRFTALRQFLGHLVDSGANVHGHVLGKTLDVDRPEDVAQAERFLVGASW